MKKILAIILIAVILIVSGATSSTFATSVYNTHFDANRHWKYEDSQGNRIYFITPCDEYKIYINQFTVHFGINIDSVDTTNISVYNVTVDDELHLDAIGRAEENTEFNTLILTVRELFVKGNTYKLFIPANSIKLSNGTFYDKDIDYTYTVNKTYFTDMYLTAHANVRQPITSKNTSSGNNNNGAAISTFPKNNASTGMYNWSSVSFNCDIESLDTQGIQVYDVTDATYLPLMGAAPGIYKHQLVIIPEGGFKVGHLYMITVASGSIKLIDGSTYDSDIKFQFSKTSEGIK